MSLHIGCVHCVLCSKDCSITKSEGMDDFHWETWQCPQCGAVFGIRIDLDWTKVDIEKKKVKKILKKVQR